MSVAVSAVTAMWGTASGSEHRGHNLTSKVGTNVQCGTYFVTHICNDVVVSKLQEILVSFIASDTMGRVFSDFSAM